MTIQTVLRGTILTPTQIIEDGALVLADGAIHHVGTRDTMDVPRDAQVIDARDAVIAPGLIDLHTYGCLGVAITSPERAADELAMFSRNVARFGVTRFLISPTMGERA